MIGNGKRFFFMMNVISFGEFDLFVLKFVLNCLDFFFFYRNGLFVELNSFIILFGIN